MKSIIISGNCQGAELKNILLRGDFGEPVRVKWRRTFDNEFFPADRVTADDFRTCDLLLLQVGSWGGDDVPLQELPKSCAVVTFPPLGLDAVWPLGFKDPRNERCALKGYEPYPHGAADKLAFELLDEGVAPDDLPRRYQAVNIDSVCDAPRMLEFLDAKARQVEEKCTVVGFADYIDKHFRSTRLFLTRNHPTGELMARLLAAIVAKSPLDEWLRNKDFLIEVTARGRGIGEFEDPVNPQVASALGLEWVGPDTRYVYYHEGSFDFDERLRRYARFQFNEDLLLLRREMGANRLGEATLKLALGAVAYDPTNWYVLFNLAELLRRLGDRPGHTRCLEQAVRAAPEAWAARHALASDLLAHGQLEKAACEQELAVRLNPDKAAVHYQKGLIAERMGHKDRALPSYVAALRLEPNNKTARLALERLG